MTYDLAVYEPVPSCVYALVGPGGPIMYSRDKQCVEQAKRRRETGSLKLAVVAIRLTEVAYPESRRR